MESRDLVDVTPKIRRQLMFDAEASTRELEDKGKDDLLESNSIDDKEQISDGLEPEVGMEFRTENEAYDFYNKFGRLNGFSIRKHNRTIDNKTGVLKFRRFVCCKEGQRGSDKRDVNVKHHRDPTRTGCEAFMTITLGQNGNYCVSKFQDNHNHDVVSPSKAHLLRSQRKLTLAQAAVADDCEKSGIAPKATHEFMSRQAGGRENIGFLQVDYRNYLRTKRMRAMEIFDTSGLFEFFNMKQVEDPLFFYSIQVDSESCITNIFWADGRMVIDYERFGDVVCFDTTYRTNEYGRPFAPFIGVNHHKQTILFGAALLYDETIESFTWLFKTFCKAMSGKKPQTILTDQDKAMSKAIEMELPGTIHRICVWHLWQNAVKHLSAYFAASKAFAAELSKCIYDYDEEDEFLEAWKNMLRKYDLCENTWLAQIFSQRERWALVYGKNTFCADMKSTQRCESMNKDIKKYLDPKQNMLGFFDHFQRLLDDRRNAELEANFKMTQSSPNILLPVGILKHAAKVYTAKVYQLFEIEYVRGMDWQVEVVNSVGTVTEYKVFNSSGRSHTVTFDKSDDSITCSCKKFIFLGILCGHSLKATNHTLQCIPTKYIMKRWTREAASCSLKTSSNGSVAENQKKDMSSRYNGLVYNFVKIATKAAESVKATELAAKLSELMLQDVEQALQQEALEKPSEHPECVGDEVARHADNTDVTVDNAQSTTVNAIKRKVGVNRGKRRLKGCLEKKSRKKGQKKKEPQTSSTLVDVSTCPPPLQSHAAIIPSVLISQGIYNSGMNFIPFGNQSHAQFQNVVGHSVSPQAVNMHHFTSSIFHGNSYPPSIHYHAQTDLSNPVFQGPYDRGMNPISCFGVQSQHVPQLGHTDNFTQLLKESISCDPSQLTCFGNSLQDSSLHGQDPMSNA